MKQTEQSPKLGSAHEQGYIDYMTKGITARNPYAENTHEFRRWNEGFIKARQRCS